MPNQGVVELSKDLDSKTPEQVIDLFARFQKGVAGAKDNYTVWMFNQAHKIQSENDGLKMPATAAKVFEEWFTKLCVYSDSEKRGDMQYKIKSGDALDGAKRKCLQSLKYGFDFGHSDYSNCYKLQQANTKRTNEIDLAAEAKALREEASALITESLGFEEGTEEHTVALEAAMAEQTTLVEDGGSKGEAANDDFAASQVASLAEEIRSAQKAGVSNTMLRAKVHACIQDVRGAVKAAAINVAAATA